MPDAYRSTILLFFAACLGLFAYCAEPRPPQPPPSPFVMAGKEGVYLNTFSLSQSDLPLFGRVDEMPGPPEFQLLPEDTAKAVIDRLFEAHGHALKKDYRFNFGRIHARLDGYDRKRFAGYFYISKDDFETPKSPAGKRRSSGYFYTEKSPDKVSIPELMMLERLNGQERAYIALINAHQFAWRRGDEGGREKMLRRLEARVELYLKWVDARRALRRKKAGGTSRP